MIQKNKRRLGDMLVQLGAISGDQLQEELKKQKINGKRLGETLIEDGLISEDQMLSLLEVQLSIPRVQVNMLSIDENVIKKIPEALARKHIILPVAVQDGMIKVVMSDPLDLFAADDIKLASGYEVEPFISSKNEILKAIDKYYSGEYVKQVASEATKEREDIVQEEKDNKIDFDDVKNAPIVRLIDSIFQNAVKAKASDIHIEPFEKNIRVRYRIDGELKEVLSLGSDLLSSLVTRVKILSNLNIAEKRVPQDGRALINVEGKEIDLRISIIPTVYGEKTVIRILDKDNSLIGIDNLGLNDDDKDKLNNILKSPYGIVLVTGPTGSGKSTTLYSILTSFNTPQRNIVTVEDPVEFLLEGINQTNVNVKAGLTFASGLRSILRQDPDIIMIGEIRDNETAEIAIKAALTGHLVLSTLHTNDAPSSIIRLVDMGIEPYLVASAITGVISQRLVKKICPHCKTSYAASLYEKKILNMDEDEDVTLYKGKGCPSCNNTGYSGRCGVYEIMDVDRKHREYILSNRPVDEFRDMSIKEGMRTLSASCKDLVLSGMTTVDEMAKIAFLKD